MEGLLSTGLPHLEITNIQRKNRKFDQRVLTEEQYPEIVLNLCSLNKDVRNVKSFFSFAI